MSKFSDRSKERLATCHPDLQTIFNEVIKRTDCSVLCGERTEDEQNAAFRDGLSQLKFPESRHNTSPSMAVDVVPYPIDWKDRSRFCHFAGFVLGTAEMLKIVGKISHDLRWGGDWDRDNDLKDNIFNDFPHFELIV